MMADSLVGTGHAEDHRCRRASEWHGSAPHPPNRRRPTDSGPHAANNLYSALFANYTNSALQTESIFLVTELDAVYALISFWVMAVIFHLVLLRQDTSPVREPGELIDGGN
jgi:hypothetical protein